MKKFLLNIILLFLFSTCFAQTSKFDEIKQTIEQKIKLNLWYEVLLLAPDLIIEDFTKGDGYYYTALAFQRLGDEDNTKKYIQKAKSIADEELIQRINQLEQDMESQTELQNAVKNAIDFELFKNISAAASSWYQAWQLDKYKIEYALNAVSHYIDLKDYEKALEVLNQPQVYQDQLAKDLIKKINNTPAMVSLNGYKSAIADGDKYFKQEMYEQAKSSYEKALKFKSNDTYASTKIREMIEEIAWEKAKNAKYIEDVEAYANSYPYGKYIDEANDIIKRSYISISKKAYQESNETQLVDFYNKYQKRFPRDTDIEKIKTLLLDFYFNSAESSYKLKYWSKAKDFYNKHLKLSPNSTEATYCQKQINKCTRKSNQSSADFWMYTYDTKSPLGISVGSMNKNGLGGYATLKMNGKIFTGFDVLWTIDDNGISDSPRDIVPTGEKQDANISLSGGLTFKLVYPLWGYLGVGIGYYPRYEEVDEYDSSGNLYETVWMRNTDKTKWGLFPEGGLRLKLGDAVVLKYGVTYYNGLTHQFGLGFQF